MPLAPVWRRLVFLDQLNDALDALTGTFASNAAVAAKQDADLAANPQTGAAYTFVAADAQRVVLANRATAQVLTIPNDATVAWPAEARLRVVQQGVGPVSIVAGSSVTVLGSPSGLTIAQQGGYRELRRIAANTWIVSPFVDPATKANALIEYVPWNTTSKTLALTDNNKCILATSTNSPVLTIPRDSSLNLPIGFSCQVLADVIGVSAEWTLTVVSEVMSGTFGTPLRYANPYSHPSTTPVVIYAQAQQSIWMQKTGADKWWITGNYVP